MVKGDRREGARPDPNVGEMKGRHLRITARANDVKLRRTFPFQDENYVNYLRGIFKP